VDKAQNSSSFVIDVQKIRDRARADIAQGAVTDGYKADRTTVIRLLNEALATEIVCNPRYRRHYFMSGALGGIAGVAIQDELLEHANQEQEHADRIAERIVQLGGEPNFNPEGLTSRAHADYAEGNELADMLREDLIAERIAIDTYGEIVRYIGDKDPTTRRLFEDILEQEEEHADDLSDFLQRLSGAPRATAPR
jgi:bacterioferritin